MTEKLCATCKQIKPLSEFRSKTKSRDGKDWSCKECLKKYDAAYKLRPGYEAPKYNPERYQESRKRAGYILSQKPLVFADKKECSCCHAIKPLSEFYPDKECKLGVRPKCITCTRRYYHENAKRFSARQRVWIENNKERYLAKTRGRKAIAKAIRDGQLQPADTKRCQLCSKQATGYHHHKGYDDENLLNVIPLCSSCHTKENLKTKPKT
jgi:hypothetical protein